MKKAFAMVVGACWGVCAAGCTYEGPRQTASIKPTSTKQVSTKPVAPTPADIKPADTKAAESETERARAAQARQCAQRHVDRANGALNETIEQKRDRDEICSAFYRGG